MSRVKIVLIILIAIIILTMTWSVFAFTRSVDTKGSVVTIIIKQGDSFNSVVQLLLENRVIESEFWLRFPARIMGVDKKITPGRYDFTGRNSCRSILNKLRNAEFVRIKVTIPEGSTIWRVAQILQNKLEIDSVSVVALGDDSAFLTTNDIPCLEGYLFPETYFIPWGTSVKQIAGKMIMMYHAKTDSLWLNNLSAELNRADIIILASIVEAETRLESERRTVASVYTNRLRRGMKLDADPTVIYGMGGLNRPLWLKDLKKDSPYNTYLNRGLPPTPINSPGLAAIKAALEPEETGYLFFVADTSGGHIFSRTNAEHNRARRRIKSATIGNN